jgi:hypothetical protein
MCTRCELKVTQLDAWMNAAWQSSYWQFRFAHYPLR